MKTLLDAAKFLLESYTPWKLNDRCWDCNSLYPQHKANCIYDRARKIVNECDHQYKMEGGHD